MSMRTALSQARVVTIGVLAAVVWTIIVGLRVFDSIDFWGVAEAGVVGDAIGTNAAGGILGLLVMAIALLAALQLLAELGNSDPAPEAWPPNE
jgi:hypothetical protein